MRQFNPRSRARRDVASHYDLHIGCGWAGLTAALNEIAGADVLGITLSTEQLLDVVPITRACFAAAEAAACRKKEAAEVFQLAGQ